MKQPDMYGIKRFLRPVVYGIVAGTVACFLLLTFMSVVMQFRDLPQMLITFVATLTFVLGGLVAGYVSAAFSREKAALTYPATKPPNTKVKVATNVISICGRSRNCITTDMKVSSRKQATVPATIP